MRIIKKIAPVVSLLLWDAATAILSVYLAFKLCFWMDERFPDYYDNNLFLYMIGVAVVSISFNVMLGCYNRVWRSYGFDDIIRQLIAVFLDTGVLFVVDRWAKNYVENKYSTDKPHLPVTGFVILAMLLIVFAICGRSSSRIIRNTSARVQSISSSGSQPIIIYGAGEAGGQLIKRIYSHPEMNMHVVALIDDDEMLKGKRMGGVLIRGGFSELEGAIDRYNATEVIVAIPTASHQFIRDVFAICRKKNCTARRFGTIDDADMSKAGVRDINLEELLRRDKVNLNMDIVRHFIEGKVVMVTGGAGSIGSEICRQVLKLGCKKLVIFDIHENGLFDIDNELLETWTHENFEVRLGSVRDRHRLNDVFDEFNPKVVFHAAAHKHVPMMELNPGEAIKNNVMGTINTSQVALMHKVEKFILISTDKAVNPTNIMGASKRVTELVIQMMDTVSDTDFAAVRFGNVLGSNGSVVPFFRKQIMRGGPVTITHPDMRRYFMTIPEAVELVLEAGAMANGGEIFVLDMGKPVRIRDLACDLIRLSGYQPDVDIKIIYTGLRPGEKLFEEISLAEEDVNSTANEKIRIMKPISNDPHELAARIKDIEKAISDGDVSAMFTYIKQLVPTFKHEQP